MKSLRKVTLGVAVGLLALVASAANSAPLPSGGATLEKGLTFSVADKTFTITDVVTSTSGTASIGTLTVIPDIVFIPSLGNFGIGFDIVGSVFAAGLGSSADVLVKYTVHVDDPAMLISDAHLFIAGSGSPGVGVDEILFNGVTLAGDMHVNGLSPADDLPTLLTGPVQDLAVTKDIFAIALGDDIVQWSAVGQLFTQVVGNENVPEPLTLLLFGAGLAGLGLVRRRKTS